MDRLSHAPQAHVNKISPQALADAVREQIRFLYGHAPGKTFIAGNAEKSLGGRVRFHSQGDPSGLDNLAADAALRFESNLPAWLPLNKFTGTPIRSGRRVIFRSNQNVGHLCAFGLDFDPVEHGGILDYLAVRRFIEKRCRETGLPRPNGYMIGRGVWALWLITPCEASKDAQQVYKDTRRSLREIFRPGCAELGCDVCPNGGVSPCSVLKVAGSASEKDGITIRHRLEVASEVRHTLAKFSQVVSRSVVPFLPKVILRPKVNPSARVTSPVRPVPNNVVRFNLARLRRDRVLARIEAFAESGACGLNWRRIADDYRRGYQDYSPRSILHRKPRRNRCLQSRAALVRYLPEIGHRVYPGHRRTFVRAVAHSLRYGENLRGDELRIAVRSICDRVIEDSEDWGEVDAIVTEFERDVELWRETGGEHGHGPKLTNAKFFEALALNKQTARRVRDRFAFKSLRGRRSFAIWLRRKFFVHDAKDRLACAKRGERTSFVAALIASYPKSETAQQVRAALRNDHAIRLSIKTIRKYRQRAGHIAVGECRISAWYNPREGKGGCRVGNVA